MTAITSPVVTVAVVLDGAGRGRGAQEFIEYFERMATEYPGKRVHLELLRAEAGGWPRCVHARRGAA